MSLVLGATEDSVPGIRTDPSLSQEGLVICQMSFQGKRAGIPRSVPTPITLPCIATTALSPPLDPKTHVRRWISRITDMSLQDQIVTDGCLQLSDDEI